MDRLAPGRDGCRDDARDPQVALRCGRRPETDGLVGQANVQRVAVGGRVDGDGLEPELVHRSDHADGDLAPVGDEDAREHRQTDRRAADGLDLEQERPELDRLPVLDVDRADAAVHVRLELVEELHRLEQAQRLAGSDDVADGDERRRARLRGAVEEPDHRRLDPSDRRRCRAVGSVDLRDRVAVGRCRHGRRCDTRLVGAPHGDAHPLVLDLDLADARTPARS